MGESKGDVYRSMIIEAIIIGLTGTITGTAIGMALVYYVQENGSLGLSPDSIAVVAGVAISSTKLLIDQVIVM